MTIAEIRKNASIIDVVGHYINVENSEDFKKARALCPFHDDHNPSMGFFKTKDGEERFKCFVCGENGSTIDFVKKYEATLGHTLSDAEAVEKVAKICGLAFEKKGQGKEDKFLHDRNGEYANAKLYFSYTSKNAENSPKICAELTRMLNLPFDSNTGLSVREVLNSYHASVVPSQGYVASLSNKKIRGYIEEFNLPYGKLAIPTDEMTASDVGWQAKIIDVAKDYIKVEGDSPRNAKTDIPGLSFFISKKGGEMFRWERPGDKPLYGNAADFIVEAERRRGHNITPAEAAMRISKKFCIDYAFRTNVFPGKLNHDTPIILCDTFDDVLCAEVTGKSGKFAGDRGGVISPVCIRELNSYSMGKLENYSAHTGKNVFIASKSTKESIRRAIILQKAGYNAYVLPGSPSKHMDNFTNYLNSYMKPYEFALMYGNKSQALELASSPLEKADCRRKAEELEK